MLRVVLGQSFRSGFLTKGIKSIRELSMRVNEPTLEVYILHYYTPIALDGPGKLEVLI